MARHSTFDGRVICGTFSQLVEPALRKPVIGGSHLDCTVLPLWLEATLSLKVEFESGKKRSSTFQLTVPEPLTEPQDGPEEADYLGCAPSYG